MRGVSGSGHTPLAYAARASSRVSSAAGALAAARAS